MPTLCGQTSGGHLPSIHRVATYGADVSVTFADIERAGDVVAAHLPPTPVWSYPLLDEALGTQVFVKHENVQPTGAFKVRGGVTFFAGMSAADLERGVVTASTGNHAQSIAYGARSFGSSAIVVMPASAPQEKARAVGALGADVILHGATLQEAIAHALEVSAATGRQFVGPGSEPAIIAGHGTVYLELFRQVPDLDLVVVPIGSGTGASGACLVANELAPACRVVGVQSSAAPAAQQAWLTGEAASAPCRTRASGLATGASFELPQSLLAGRLSDFILVTDDELDSAAALLASHAHTLAETAGAAGVAALRKAGAPSGRRVALVCSGGNASAGEVAAIARLVGEQSG